MTTIYKKRIYCTTDSQWEYKLDEDDTALTVCPIDSGHTVNVSSFQIVDVISSSKVEIKEESVATGGHFQSFTVHIDATANTTSTADVSYPFPISSLLVKFTTSSDHEGDIVNMSVGPDTIVGNITVDVSTSSAWSSQNYTEGQIVTYNSKQYTCILDTVSNEIPTDTTYWTKGHRISVSSTVITHTKIGFYIKLYDGTNQDDVGRVLSKDTVNNYIYVEKNLTNSFSASTPTYIQQTIYVIKDYEIGLPQEHTIGESKIGGSYIPTDTIVRVYYENKHATQDKTFIGVTELLY